REGRRGCRGRRTSGGCGVVRAAAPRRLSSGVAPASTLTDPSRFAASAAQLTFSFFFCRAWDTRQAKTAYLRREPGRGPGSSGEVVRSEVIRPGGRPLMWITWSERRTAHERTIALAGSG